MYHLRVSPFMRSEDESVREVIRICRVVPREEMGHKHFLDRVLHSWKINIHLVFNVHTCYTSVCLDVNNRKHLLYEQNATNATQLLYLANAKCIILVYYLGKSCRVKSHAHSVAIKFFAGSKGLRWYPCHLAKAPKENGWHESSELWWWRSWANMATSY